MAKIIRALTLKWLREKSYEAGTEFAVVDVPNPDADNPVEIDPGTADLWVRHKTVEVVKTSAPGKPAK